MVGRGVKWTLVLFASSSFSPSLLILLFSSLFLFDFFFLFYSPLFVSHGSWNHNKWPQPKDELLATHLYPSLCHPSFSLSTIPSYLLFLQLLIYHFKLSQLLFNYKLVSGSFCGFEFLSQLNFSIYHHRRGKRRVRRRSSILFLPHHDANRPKNRPSTSLPPSPPKLSGSLTSV